MAHDDASNAAAPPHCRTAVAPWAIVVCYARELYRNPENIDAAFYAERKRHYSEAQIMELGAFVAFHYGMQIFARTL